MTTYRKPIDLESLQAYLHGRGFKTSILTVTSGVETLNFSVGKQTVVVDQAGNVVADDNDYKSSLEAAIREFRNG